MKLKNVLVVHKMGYSSEEKKAVDAVLETMKRKRMHKSAEAIIFLSMGILK